MRANALLVCSLLCLVSHGTVAAPATQPVDLVAVNDLLCVGICDRPADGETLKTVRVDSQGKVSLYYVGQVKIVGKTFEQAEKEIAEAYRGTGVLNNAYPSINRLETAGNVSVTAGKITAGERLSLRIFEVVPDIEEARVLTVSEGGKVGLPLLGQFKLAGLTEAEAEQAIARAMEDQFNLKNIPVSVLRLGSRQQSEPTVAAEPNARAALRGARR
jgi:protein involved in polysaccharide export with SLBB domain